MKIINTAIADVLLIETAAHGDARGWFSETWQAQRYMAAGVTGPFVQDNAAYSTRGALRGLHAQHPHAQGKLVQVLAGEVFDVAVDIRQGSPTFGQWVGEYLSADNHRQMWVPPGLAHGYLVTSETALFMYKCTDYYHPDTEFSIRWNDPDISITWPEGPEPEMSDKDRSAPHLKDLSPERLPRWSGEK